MEQFIVERDGAPDLRFTGELVCSTSSSANNASSYYSGSTGRWRTLKLWKTQSGKFVCQSVGHTQWQGEKTRYSAAVCDDDSAVMEFFGHGWLAKDLYSEAGIEAVEDLD